MKDTKAFNMEIGGSLEEEIAELERILKGANDESPTDRELEAAHRAIELAEENK